MRGLMARVEDERMTLSICIIQAILQKWMGEGRWTLFYC